ncbi:hypothetical protein [Ignatzschineria sp. LJL83]
MVDCLKKAFSQSNFSEDLIIYEKNSHSFPDVLIKDTNIGIELKGAITGNTFNGNSVFGSTFKKGLEKIYLLYWISDQQLVAFDDYFNCVEDAVVTHSPRFRLKVNLPAKNRMFGNNKNQVGSIENIIYSPEGIQVDKILTWMKEKAIRNNESPWWITLSEDDDVVVNSINSIKIGKKSLSEEELQRLNLYSYIFFPELLDRPGKYNRVTAWGISVHGIVINRDFFSAGGKEILPIIPGYTTTIQENIPRSLYSFITLLQKKDISISITKTDLIYLELDSDTSQKKFIEKYLRELAPKLNILNDNVAVQRFIKHRLIEIIKIQ